MLCNSVPIHTTDNMPQGAFDCHYNVLHLNSYQNQLSLPLYSSAELFNATVFF